jgi:16S rRNA (uracil1498-N3)-methyltransferase
MIYSQDTTSDFANYSKMIKHRFFIDGELSVDQQIEASEELTHYMSNVLRLRCGSYVVVFNNTDNEFICKLRIEEKQRIIIDIVKSVEAKRESSLQLYLAMSLIRSDRFDFAIQKATELGIQGICPIISKFTQIKMNLEQQEKRLKHWQGVATSACEQSGRTKVPVIAPPCSLTQLLVSEKDSQLLFLHPNEDDTSSAESITSLLQNNAAFNQQKIICLIGPEGGWQEEEIELFEQRKIPKLSLGNRVLRSETAAIVVTSLMQLNYGDLN